MIERLLPRLGFAWMMRVIGFVFLGLLIVAMCTIESRIAPTPKKVRMKEFISPLQETPFLFNALGGFFFFWGVFLPFNFLVLEGQHLGFSESLATYLIAILNGAR